MTKLGGEVDFSGRLQAFDGGAGGGRAAAGLGGRQDGFEGREDPAGGRVGVLVCRAAFEQSVDAGLDAPLEVDEHESTDAMRERAATLGDEVAA
ncbi:MAG: hypothetical protein IAI48_12210, partial [Candidatus Eremiobacteraeota bacterium]|nr:hypothetical protein [Candidatus Eremiobacteraeota bacterium]